MTYQLTHTMKHILKIADSMKSSCEQRFPLCQLTANIGLSTVAFSHSRFNLVAKLTNLLFVIG